MAPKVHLGAFLAGDRSLSEPDGQSCASCHFPTAGYADPDQDLPVSEGVISGLFGGRNAPPWAYAVFSPALRYDEGETLYVGGQFWDGRAAGESAVEQAKGPFLNPVEMANPYGADVRERDVDVRGRLQADLRTARARGRRGDLRQRRRAIAAYESSRG